jgi:hypothetical protein
MATSVRCEVHGQLNAGLQHRQAVASADHLQEQTVSGALLDALPLVHETKTDPLRACLCLAVRLLT